MTRKADKDAPTVRVMERGARVVYTRTDDGAGPWQGVVKSLADGVVVAEITKPSGLRFRHVARVDNLDGLALAD